MQKLQIKFKMDRNTFHCIDAHMYGNPVRVIKQGGPDLKGAKMSEKRQYFLNADEVVLGAGSWSPLLTKNLSSEIISNKKPSLNLSPFNPDRTF